MKHFFHPLRKFFGTEPGYRTLRLVVKVQNIPQRLRTTNNYDFISIYEMHSTAFIGIAYISLRDYTQGIYEIGYFEEMTNANDVLKQFLQFGIRITPTA